MADSLRLADASLCGGCVRRTELDTGVRHSSGGGGLPMVCMAAVSAGGDGVEGGGQWPRRGAFRGPRPALVWQRVG